MIQIQIRPYYRIKIPQGIISTAAELALQKCQPKEVIVGILITGDAEIHALNREYRNMDKPTDVLSLMGTTSTLNPDWNIWVTSSSPCHGQKNKQLLAVIVPNRRSSCW